MTFSFKYTNPSYYCGSNPTSHYENMSLKQLKKHNIVVALKQTRTYISAARLDYPGNVRSHPSRSTLKRTSTSTLSKYTCFSGFCCFKTSFIPSIKSSQKRFHTASGVNRTGRTAAGHKYNHRSGFSLNSFNSCLHKRDKTNMQKKLKGLPREQRVQQSLTVEVQNENFIIRHAPVCF